jgi:chorismate mutase
MAYFDSPKNRAFWSRELDQLRTLREARKNGLDDESVKRATRTRGDPFRERTSFRELMAEERAGKRRPFEFAKTSPTLSKEREKSMAGLAR